AVLGLDVGCRTRVEECLPDIQALASGFAEHITGRVDAKMADATPPEVLEEDAVVAPDFHDEWICRAIECSLVHVRRERGEMPLHTGRRRGIVRIAVVEHVRIG